MNAHGRLRPILLLTLVALSYAAVLHKFGVQGYFRFTAASGGPGPTDKAAAKAFLSDGQSATARYQALFAYFRDGQLAVTDAAGSRAHYRGEPSLAGYSINGMEAFVRGGTLLSAWIASGRDTKFIDSTGATVDLVAYIKRGVLAGTDPASPGYWGPIRSWDQRIVEAADVARILWMTRARIWEQFKPEQQARISGWLHQVDGADIPQNVWLLFPVTVDATLRSLGQPGLYAYARSNHAKFMVNYLSNGWFTDPPEGVNFYSAWGAAYELFWIDRIDPQFDHERIRNILHDAAEVDAHLISPAGIPIMGRSPCYRTAVPTPLLVAAIAGDESIDPGLARHALDVTWRYFVAHGALQDGTLTQGYFGNDPRFLDLYSGPGSCGGWGVRALLLALLQPDDAPIWQAAPQPLPVERADYQLTYEKLGWRISGTRSDGDITIEIDRNRGRPVSAPRPYSIWRRLLEPVFCRPFRPENDEVRYERERYSALHPFFLEQ